MGAIPIQPKVRIRLEPFQPRHAPTIASWVSTPEQLFWLAPSSIPPLTTEQILTWQQADGRSFVGFVDGEVGPAAYAELNPVRNRCKHLWLGHCVVRPSLRGAGVGLQFVRELLIEAFDRMDASKVALIVFPANQGALRCYRRCHFRPTGEELHRFGSSVTHRLLRLEATPASLREFVDVDDA
jgi:RimJ/RimL family protein N-acetyltransferase